MQVLRATTGEVVALKPAGLPCEMPRDAAADSLVGRIAQAGHGRPFLVHRLDAAACGLLLLARTRDAAAFYSAEIAARRWFKLYVARVAGDGVDVGGLLGPHRAYLKTVGRRAEIVRAGGKPSFLDVEGVWAAPDDSGDQLALVRLHTGRFHQIRAMLAHAGAPLRGDALYGGPPGRLYLEHVVLGSRTFGDHLWTVWEAPPHADRGDWGSDLAAAVADAAATARTAPPPRDPDR